MGRLVSDVLEELAEVAKSDHMTVNGQRISAISVNFGVVEVMMYFDAELPYEADGYRPRYTETYPWEAFVVRNGVRYYKLLSKEDFRKRVYGGNGNEESA